MAVAVPASWPDVARLDERLYDEYAGTYELSPETRVVVTNEAGNLMAQVTGQEKVELFPESATSFFDRTDSPLARTVFERVCARKAGIGRLGPRERVGNDAADQTEGGDSQQDFFPHVPFDAAAGRTVAPPMSGGHGSGVGGYQNRNQEPRRAETSSHSTPVGTSVDGGK